MAKYTDQELITVFMGAEVKGQKRWQVCLTPRANPNNDYNGDKIVYFSAPNAADAKQMATEYGMRIAECRVRWIYQDKGF